jgi:hypothetical protein
VRAEADAAPQVIAHLEAPRTGRGLESGRVTSGSWPRLKPLSANAVAHDQGTKSGGTFTVRLRRFTGYCVRGETEDEGSSWNGNLGASAREASGLIHVLNPRLSLRGGTRNRWRPRGLVLRGRLRHRPHLGRNAGAAGRFGIGGSWPRGHEKDPGGPDAVVESARYYRQQREKPTLPHVRFGSGAAGKGPAEAGVSPTACRDMLTLMRAGPGQASARTQRVVPARRIACGHDVRPGSRAAGGSHPGRTCHA